MLDFSVAFGVMPLENCQKELLKICNLPKPDDVRACVEKHINNLSPQCKKEIKDMQFCQMEIAKYCNISGEYTQENMQKLKTCIKQNIPKTPLICRDVFSIFAR